METPGKYEVIPRDEQRLVKIEDYAMSIDSLVGQVALIQKVMEKVMHEGEHYGKIPGTDKPTLLKPGAEKLCLTFRLNPNYDIIEKVREKDFIAYTVRCDLTHIMSQTPVASGIGSCNSRETKYRYRMVATEQKPSKEDAAVLKAKGLGRWKKIGEAWTWMERIENDNPWDLDNTLIKMACKRALVAATLNATAASDIFTQDVEDMPPEIVNGDTHTTKPPSDEIPDFKKPKEKPKPEPKRSSSNFDFLNIMKEHKKELGDEIYYQILGEHGYEHANEITTRDHQVMIYKEMITAMESGDYPKAQDPQQPENA